MLHTASQMTENRELHNPLTVLVFLICEKKIGNSSSTIH